MLTSPSKWTARLGDCRKLDFYISAIAIAHDSSFKTDQDILVLPLDLLKYDTHEKLTQDVLKHFGKVYSVFFLIM